jgi:hypothetical protein
MALIKLTLTGLAFLFFCQSVIAQQSNAQVKGVIQDTDGAPVPFATVVLLTKDSAFVTGDITKDDGSFSIASIKAASYRLKVQNIEYETYVTDIFNVTDKQIKSLSPILLTKAVTELAEMTVTAKKELVEIHPDKMVFNVSSSANASGNNGLELLSKAPGVLVDPDNNIILQGKSGVRIFINGRPTRLSGTDLATMLQSMQSDNIESIEIITNPSAKYEAEGNAGIINIKLKKNANLGYNGTIVSNISKGDLWRNNNGITLNYRGSKVNLSGDVTRFDNDFQNDFIDVKEQSGFLLDQKSLGINHNDGYNFSAGIDYMINDKHSLALSGRGIITNSRNNVHSETGITETNTNTLTEILSSGSHDKADAENFNYNLNYQFNISKTSSLSADVSLGNFINFRGTNQPNQYLEPDGYTVNREVNNAFDSDTEIDLWSGKLDYEKKFDKITLSAGGKYSSINTDNKFDFYRIEGSTPVLDINKSNDFTYTEKVSAIYLITNSKLTQKITLNAGLRMEHTLSEGHLKSQTAVENKDVVRNYTNYFPNVGLSYSNKKNLDLSLSVGRRITRPNYQDLNPFESKLSELVYFKGNPFLRPNYVMNYQVSLSYKQKLVITNVYSITNDFFASILRIVNEKGTFLIPENMQRITNNGLSVSYPITFTKWWEASSFLNYNYSTFDGDIEGTVINLTANIYNFRIQNNFTVPGKISIDLTYFYNSPFVWRGSLKIDELSGVNLGIKKDLFDGKLQLRATASDIFNDNSDYRYRGNYGGIRIDGALSVDNRRFGVGLTYKFGNQKVKSGKKKSALDEELNRIGS